MKDNETVKGNASAQRADNKEITPPPHIRQNNAHCGHVEEFSDDRATTPTAGHHDASQSNAQNYLRRKFGDFSVQWLPLGEVADLKRGKTITQKDVIDGDIPVISGGQKPAYYHNEYNREGETITIAGSGAYAGFITYWDKPIFVADAFSIKSNGVLKMKYVYYFLQSKQSVIFKMKTGAGIPHVYPKDVAKIIIPIPPLEVQEEVVRILDKFSRLTSELQKELDAELKARKLQYEYYRDQLLSFGTDDPTVQWLPLEDAFYMRNGYTPSKSVPEYWENGTIPWFRMEDIRTNGGILSDSIQHITPEAVKGGRLFPSGSIILSTTATIGEHALLIADSLANQRFTNLVIRESLSNKLDIKFFYYYMFIVDDWCKRNTNVSGFASVDMKKLKKLPIPIPPIEEQERIVGILDKFDKLTNSLTEGIPKEIEMRQLQYEYYRDALLSF